MIRGIFCFQININKINGLHVIFEKTWISEGAFVAVIIQLVISKKIFVFASRQIAVIFRKILLIEELL